LQWLILFYTLKNIRAGSAEEVKSVKLQQKGDMQIAWKLLECETHAPDEAQAIDLLRLDVAQRYIFMPL